MILENHGVVVGGPSLQIAFQRFETLEFAAQTLIRAALIGEPRFLSEDNAAPVNATAFSVTGIPFDSRTIPESYILLRHVGRVPYGVQFRDPDRVAEAISASCPALLLENDGVMVAGRTVLEAFDRLEVLESTARRADQRPPARARGAHAGRSDRRAHQGLPGQLRRA